MLAFFQCINDEPNYLGGQVVPGTFSRLFYMVWKIILRGKGSLLNSGCTRYSHQQMVGFECWNKWPGLSRSSKGFTSPCKDRLFVPLDSTVAKANLSEWDLQIHSQNHTVSESTSLLLGQHHFPGVSWICLA